MCYCERVFMAEELKWKLNFECMFHFLTVKLKNEYSVKYTFSNSKLRWVEANAECSRVNASLLDFADKEDMLHLAQTNFTRGLWIGLKKNASKLTPVTANNTDEYLEAEIWPLCYGRDHKGNTSHHCNSLFPSVCVKRINEGKINSVKLRKVPKHKHFRPLEKSL